jgi:hypothetical protein
MSVCQQYCGQFDITSLNECDRAVQIICHVNQHALARLIILQNIAVRPDTAKTRVFYAKCHIFTPPFSQYP